jgi:NADPH:quinone reductase-like Zn-dependent oxidoreductase
MVTDEPDWVDAVRDLIGGRTVGVALDPIGGALSADLLGLLSPGGRVVVYGRMADEPVPVHASALLDRGLTMRGRHNRMLGRHHLTGAACLRHHDRGLDGASTVRPVRRGGHLSDRGPVRRHPPRHQTRQDRHRAGTSLNVHSACGESKG